MIVSDSRAVRCDMPFVEIAQHKVGRGRRTLIVAEAGVNHNGDPGRALDMVDAAAFAGADAVKFQVFRAEELVTRDGKTAAYQKAGCDSESQQDMLTPLELDHGVLREIRDRCFRRGIMFLATPFGLNDLRAVVDLCVPAIKIASTDLTNDPLLRAAAGSGRPLIVSTGAATESEIRRAVELVEEQGGLHRLILLHCVCAYPAPTNVLNLRSIATMRQKFGVPVGFSDHSTSIESGAWAIAAGACALEKHFTLDRSSRGPDHAMSLTVEELRSYVAAIRRAETALGDGTMGPIALEDEVRRIARKSVVAAREVRPGAVLTADMLTIKRPGTGIPPGELEGLIGKRVRVALAKDTVIEWEMVQ